MVCAKARPPLGQHCFQIHTVVIALALLSAYRVPAAQASTPPNTIRLKSISVDTSAGTDVRALAPALAGSSGRHVIQLNGPMTRKRRIRLENAGVEVEGYLPVNAFIVKLDQANAEKLAELRFIRWTGACQDDWKLNPFLGQRVMQSPERVALDQQGLLQIMIVLFPGENADAIAPDLAARGANVLAQTLTGTRWYIDATIPRNDVARLAEMAAVQFVQEAPEATLQNDSNRWIAQSNDSGSEATPVWDAGIHGEGQVIGLIDRAIDLGHCAFHDPDFPVEDFPVAHPDHRKVIAWRGCPGQQDHGTHVAGTLAGDQAPFGAADNFDGLAYAAKISFSRSGEVTATPSVLIARFESARDDGAHVHSNSFGDTPFPSIFPVADFGKYTLWSLQVDQFSHDNEDQLVVFGVWNASNDPDAIGNPSNAKNCLAVAASGDGAARDSHCLGGRGPTQDFDFRRKPEIMAPGCDTQSADEGSSCGYAMATGTSYATPVVAAAATLVRQYFVDGYYPTGLPENPAIFPTGALLRAVLINGAVDMTSTPATGNEYPSDQEGWGRLWLDNGMHFPGDGDDMWVVDVWNADGLETCDERAYVLRVDSSVESLSVTMAFTDPAASELADHPVVNDLDLEVTSPTGEVFKGNVFGNLQSVEGGSFDAVNTIERVLIDTGSIAMGLWTIRVRGTTVQMGPQGYAIAVRAGLSDDCDQDGFPDAGGPDCNGNGSLDICDIDAGASRDCNGNNVPDECELPAGLRGVIYVNENATGSASGYCWQNAFLNLQDALSFAVQNPCEVSEIWVAAGTYTPDIGTEQTALDRNASFVLVNDIGVFGGFFGDETTRLACRGGPTGGAACVNDADCGAGGTCTRDVRELLNSVTILSGDLLGDDGPDFVNYGDNSKHVVTVGSDIEETTILDGFLITSGNTSGAQGAGMWISMGGPTIRNCRFQANLALLGEDFGIGGGLSNASGTPKLINCVFNSNLAGRGGGMSTGGGMAELINCTFVNNEMRDTFSAGGGGLQIAATGAKIRNCIFWFNNGVGTEEDNQLFDGSGVADIDYTNWQGHTVDASNIDSDPDFLDKDGPDNVFGTPDDDLRLKNTSLSRNVGLDAAIPADVGIDIDGGPRLEGTIDMGAYEWSDCNGNNLDDGQDFLLGVSLDCNDNGIPDECDIANGTSQDVNGSGIPDECLVAPRGAGQPHGIKKNRYISFDPTMHDIPIALQVTMTQSLAHPDALGFTRWVGEPDVNGVAELLKEELDPPVVRFWPETVIHVTGCAISPVAMYDVRASDDLGLTFTSPLSIDTIDQPVGSKWWGDTVGFFNGTEWTPPNGTTNIDDVLAANITFMNPTVFNATHLSVTDVEPQVLNELVNINDVFMIILAFQGDEYPFGCPDDPCWDKREPPDGQGPCPCVPPTGGGSGPMGPSGPATVSTLSLLPSSDLILQGELIDVEVFLDVAGDLGGYQLDVEVSGGSTGSLDLENLFIDVAHTDINGTPDYVLEVVGSMESASAYWGQIGAANLGGVGVPVSGPDYLGTFQFRASADAVGVFTIRFSDIENNFLMDGQASKITDAIVDDESFIGVEVECAIDSHCEDSNACTDDTCNNGTCVYTNDDTNACSDGNDCTDDSCSSGTCVSTNDDTNTCTDGNDCTSDVCLSAVCTSTDLPSNTACDDGLFCTWRDKCDGAGTCVGTGSRCKAPNPYCCEPLSTCGSLPCS